MEVLVKNIETVEDLKKILDKVPPNTNLNPFGSATASAVYCKEEQTLYIDDDFSWIEDEELDKELYS